METEVEKLERKFENILSVNKSLNEENRTMDKIIMKLKKDVERLKAIIVLSIER
jgi:predicted RNase H-like nuclease (RuvC/YqgF family)